MCLSFCNLYFGLFVRSRYWIDELTLTPGQSPTASPKTMSVVESQLRGLGHTSGGEESAEQKSAAAAETREGHDPNASQEPEAGSIIGMLLGNADRGDEKDGHEEGRDAEANEEVVPEEEEQETQKGSDRKAAEQHDVEEAKAQEKVPGEEKTEAEPQHEDHQKAQHEDQKEQVQRNNDGEERGGGRQRCKRNRY